MHRFEFDFFFRVKFKTVLQLHSYENNIFFTIFYLHNFFKFLVFF